MIISVVTASLILLGCTKQEYSVTEVKNARMAIDGQKNEPAWQNAEVIRSFTNPWDSKVCPATSLSMLQDSQNLYFFYEVKDDDIVLVSDFTNEENVTKEDRVELFFSKDKDMKEYYCFEIDAKARILAYSCSYYRNYNYAWEPPSELISAAVIGNKAYSVEGAIPLAFLKNLLQTDGFIYFGAYRGEFSKQGDSILENWLTWIDPKTEKPDFHVPSSLGKLKFSSKETDIRLSDTSGEQIPVLGWHGIDGNSSPERYRDMKDAGFTINFATDLVWDLKTVFEQGTERFFSSLDVSAAHKLKTLVGDAVFDYLSAEEINRMKAHPALYGYYVKDEPRYASEFSELKSRILKVQSFDNTHPCYVNLAGCQYCEDSIPNKWAPELSCGPTFEEPSPCVNFIRTFIKEVPVPMLSFDMYPIWLNTDVNQRELQLRWYYTLELMSAEAKKANKPLWAFTLSTAHKNFHYPYPLPTLNDLRLQTYSDLAYGAQCIQYFTYEYINSNGWEAPLASDGTKTAIYDTVKAMNEEIKALSPVFLNAKMIWVAHTGEIPVGCTELDKSNLPKVFNRLEIKGGKGALVSLMEKGDDNFLVIVNHDINEDITVQAKGAKTLRRVEKDGSIVKVDGKVQSLTPGDVFVYFWKK
jgi:hypothetical protein